MDVQDYFEFIDETSIRIKGHRIHIDEVLEERLQGKEPEEILCCFPRLPLEKIYATLLYYEANKTEVEAYLARVREEKRKSEKKWQRTQGRRFYSLKSENTSEKSRQNRLLRESSTRFGMNLHETTIPHLP